MTRLPAWPARRTPSAEEQAGGRGERRLQHLAAGEIRVRRGARRTRSMRRRVEQRPLILLRLTRRVAGIAACLLDREPLHFDAPVLVRVRRHRLFPAAADDLDAGGVDACSARSSSCRISAARFLLSSIALSACVRTNASPPFLRNSSTSALSTWPRSRIVEPGLTCSSCLIASRFLQVRLVREVERRRVRLEQEADVLAEQRIALERPGAAGADRRDRDLLILELPALRAP